ncbi:8138_t:CDS:2 [Racocetra fulgida]|uniref:8138_t:CDS:1 n=1 Tax=Racocetra fulgida TaxID=60492 RepID=A0A9N9FHL1_9GLOM|nr:8138_t:CDS:2 [Racocetra fulgida]
MYLEVNKNPRALKLLPFATDQKWEETEAQIRAKLLLLETQVNVSSNLEVERSLVTINEDPQDSLSAKLWDYCQCPIMLPKINLYGT